MAGQSESSRYCAGSNEVEPSLGIRLLTDLRLIFEGGKELPSKTILERLQALPESPWSDLRGKPLDERGLAKRLRAYGVKPKTIRTSSGTPRRYSKTDLEDQWRRYLPAPLGKSKTTKTSETLPEQRVADVADVLEFSAKAEDWALSGHQMQPLRRIWSDLGVPLWIKHDMAPSRM
jgi:hypothetical protein